VLLAGQIGVDDRSRQLLGRHREQAMAKLANRVQAAGGG
jgi:hypothetical protein